MAGIYLHVPFCTQRCVYCDFYFVTTEKNHTPFVRAMQVEIESYGRQYGAQEPVRTIYFGGGTPSMLSLEAVAQLLGSVYEHFDCRQVAELGFELNPENVTDEYLSGLRGLGINRLSLGIQSFHNEDLRFMGRVHDASKAHRAIEQCMGAGFEHVSIDLIFGVPGQSRDAWLFNIEQAIESGVDHISTYGLTIEERTPLAKQVERGMVEPDDDETIRNRFLTTIGLLSEAGFEHYEISNFARPGARSRHNLNYWAHGNYIGFGPSAHSLWWRSGTYATRWSNVRNLRRYVALLQQKHLPIDYRETLGLDSLADEHVMLKLRLPTDGLDLDELEQRFGVDLLSTRMDAIADLEAAGLARLRGSVLRLTTEGAAVADAVTARLLPDPADTN